MIEIINKTTLSASISGSFGIKILEKDKNYTYTIDVSGLTVSNFACTIPFSECHDKNGGFDIELAFNWLIQQMADVSFNTGAAEYNGQLIASFQQFNKETEKHESSLSGSFEIEQIGEYPKHYALRFKKIGS